MTRAIKRRLSGLVAGPLVMAMVLASQAWATPPRSTVFEFPFTGSQDCGTFTIEFSGTSRVRETAYFDNEGNPLRFVLHVSSRETDTNTSTGVAIDGRSDFRQVFDLIEGTVTLDGELFMANGRGTVIHDTGTITLDENGEVVRSAGPHEAFESEFEIFCEALA